MGFEYIWIGDYYNQKNVYETLTAIAKKTELVKLGPGITNPYLRCPEITSSAIATLDEISNGRAVLGIGPGDKNSLNMLKIKDEQVMNSIKNTIEIFKTLTANKKTKTGGEFFGVRSIQKEIDVYIGGEGEKILKLAGEIADGVLINCSNPKDYEFTMPLIKEGVISSGRKLSNIDICAHTSCSIANHYNDALKVIKLHIAHTASKSSLSLLKRHELSEKLINDMRNLINKKDLAGAIGLVNEDLVDIFSITGTADQFIEKIQVLEEMGVSQYIAGPPFGTDIESSINLLGEVVASF